MKDFLKYNWKTITLTILGIIFFYLLLRTFTPLKDMSELNKYKLEQIETRILELKKIQAQLKDSIFSYQNEVKKIDNKISKIKLERSEINNYYTIKENEIKSADRTKIDSLLKKRYNY